MTSAIPPSRSARVLIIGSGFSGIGMAMALLERGIEDVIILERADALGGTWYANRYPGCACDVESTLYSFANVPNPDWSHTFAPREEIEAYLHGVAEEFGVVPLIRFNEEVTGARWDADDSTWIVTSTSGEWRAGSLVMANGSLSDPVIPVLPGLDSFRGPSFHTARWDSGISLEGKRVAVVGTGASAIQVIPAIQPHVRELIVAQRTPAWVLPRFDGEVPAWRRALYRRLPIVHSFVRLVQHVKHETLFLPFRHASVRRIAEWLVGLHLKRQVDDPELRAALTPTYAIGCKRLLLSDDFYPAMTRPNVTLVPSAVARVEPDAIVTADGARHEVDVIIHATGFRVTDPILAPHITGRDGVTLADAWKGSPKAYMGTTVTGFPNLFLLLGPNTGLGHSSVVMMAESQIAHVCTLLDAMEERGLRAVEPRREAQDAFVDWMDRSLEPAVWNRGGCTSWYLDRTGRNSALWPFGVDKFRRTVGTVREDDYLFTPAT